MRKILFIVFIISTWVHSIYAEEQPYVIHGYPTIEPWQGRQHYEHSDPKFWYVHIQGKNEYVNISYKQIGDTVIDGRVYAKLGLGYEMSSDLIHERNLNLFSMLPEGSTSYVDTLLYRQEGDKIYFLPDTGDGEFLILNYGLEEGDVFTDYSGRRFIVKNKNNSEITDSSRIFNLWWWTEDVSPKSLILVSEDTGDEDIWIEGVGSLLWGITPPSVCVRARLFQRTEISTQCMTLTLAFCENMCFSQDVNEDNYKRVEFTSDIPAEDELENCSFYFVADTLCIQGKKNLNDYLTYAECMINDKKISVAIRQAFGIDDVEGLYNRSINIKVPCFKADTYEVGLAGKEHVTLVCKGANGVENISEMLRHKNQKGGVYDLSGRRVDAKAYENEKLKKGIYIMDGKKTVIR